MIQKSIIHRAAQSSFYVIIGILIIWGRASAGDDVLPQTANQSEKRLYRMKKGDTLRDLARQFLGGEEFLPELLEYNKIRNPLLADEGFMLMIPGQERAQAINELIKARDILAEALDAKADEFATDEFAIAQEAIEAAEENRRTGAYEKAIALAKLGFARTQHAIDIANSRARVEQSGRLTAVHGIIEMSDGDRASWNPVSAGQEITANTIIRTDSSSRAELTLEDGSVIQILESTEFVIRNFIYDLRTDKRTSQLEVILGNILAKIKPRKVEESTFEVKSGAAALGIRGTQLRIGTSLVQTSRVSVLEGKIIVDANQEDVEVGENLGTIVEESKPPIEPIDLLPAPNVVSPPGNVYETSAQVLDLSWDHVAIIQEKMTQRVTRYFFKKFASYHHEIATDNEFNYIIEDRDTENNHIRTGVLPPGEYYWRLSSIDNNGLRGPFNDTKKLRIVRDLTVTIVPDILPVEKGDKWIIHPTDVLNVVPGNINTSIERLEISLDNKPFQEFQGTIVLPQPGEYLVKVRGVGADDYLGSVIEQLIELDATPPEISIDVGPVQDVPDLGEVVYVILEATDNTGVDSIEYKINDEEYRPYSEKIIIDVSRKPGGVYIKGSDLNGQVVVDKLLRRALKFIIHSRAIDLVGNESVESVVLKY